MVSSSCACIGFISPDPFNNADIAMNFINTCRLGFARWSLGEMDVPAGFVQLAELRGLRVHE